MKLNLNARDQQELQCLFNMMEENIFVTDTYIEYLTLRPDYINPKKMDALLKKGKNEKEAYFNLFLKANHIEDEEEKDIFLSHHANALKKLDASHYMNDEYYKNIVPFHDAKNKWELTYKKFRPYESFTYDVEDVDPNCYYKEITKMGYFDVPFKFLAVLQNDIIWMSLAPSEIDTMLKEIDEAHGDVITFGLGLGYYAYMCSNKENVTSMTIVELDKNVIELFERNILPQFPHKEKIKIINADGFKFMKENENHYDYAFYDTWHTVDDGLEMYCKFRSLENEKIDTYAYWIEFSMITMIRRLVITYIMENFYEYDLSYDTEETFVDHLVNNLHKYLKDKEFNSYKEIHEFLSFDSLKALSKIIA